MYLIAFHRARRALNAQGLSHQDRESTTHACAGCLRAWVKQFARSRASERSAVGWGLKQEMRKYCLGAVRRGAGGCADDRWVCGGKDVKKRGGTRHNSISPVRTRLMMRNVFDVAAIAHMVGRGRRKCDNVVDGGGNEVGLQMKGEVVCAFEKIA